MNAVGGPDSPVPKRSRTHCGWPAGDLAPGALIDPSTVEAAGEPGAPGDRQAGGGLAELLGLRPEKHTAHPTPYPASRLPRPPARAEPAQDAKATPADPEPTPAARLLHTPEQAAALLQVPPSWVRKKAAAGLIPSTRIGRHLRFSQQDIDHIIRAGSRPPRRQH